MKKELAITVARTEIHTFFMASKIMTPDSAGHLIKNLLQYAKESQEEKNIVLSLELITNIYL